jgi:hypothetical protein
MYGTISTRHNTFSQPHSVGGREGQTISLTHMCTVYVLNIAVGSTPQQKVQRQTWRCIHSAEAAN